MEKEIYLIAEGGNAKKVMEAWRDEYLAGWGHLETYMDEIGAVTYSSFGTEKPSGFGFGAGAPPEGWLKPNSRGISSPKKSNRAARARLDKIAWSPDLTKTVGEKLNLPSSVSYECKSGRATGRLSRGTIATHSVCWTVDGSGKLSDVILVAPNHDKELEAMREREAEQIVWYPEGSAPEVPEGFIQVSKAEVDLIFAQAKVDREARKKQEAETPAPSM